MTADQHLTRRLAAILAADVVGYTRLMGEDEAGTLLQLNLIWAEVFNPAVARFRGRIVKTMGDGALVEFGSAVDAVTCAVAIQSAMLDRHTPTQGSPIEFRIGVNLGEIIEGADIFGDGVNVAARLEGPPLNWPPRCPAWNRRCGGPRPMATPGECWRCSTFRITRRDSACRRIH